MHLYVYLKYTQSVQASGRLGCTLVRASYVLNMPSQGTNTVFYTYLAYFVNTRTLNNALLSYAGRAKRNTLCVFVWLS